MALRTSSAATVVAVLAISVGALPGCKKPGAAATVLSDAAVDLPMRSDAAADLPTPDGAPVVEQIVVDAGPLARAIPVPQAAVDAEVNPEHLPPYSGPTGTVTGVVHVRGDEAPKVDLQIPFECGDAYQTYGRVFREGNGRTVADALVAVTGYQGYLPQQADAVNVAIAKCAYDRRTVALMYGQNVSVTNTDRQLSFIPILLGAELPAQLVAVPHGDPIRLYPPKVGHYALTDGMAHRWMYADVFVVRYRTHAVTALDGAFRIEHVPVGKLKVSAYLPAIDASLHPDVGVAAPSSEQEIELKEGETLKLDLVLTYRKPKSPAKRPLPATPAPVVH